MPNKTRKPVRRTNREPDLNEPFRKGLKDTFKPTSMPGVFKSGGRDIKRPSNPKKGRR